MIKPTGNNVHIAPIPNATITPSGLHLVQTNPGECTYFIVLAIGPKVKEVLPGDRVIARLMFDSMTLEDESKITDAGQIQMVFEK